MTDTPASSGAFNRILNAIERVGNKLPNPFMLFIYLALIVTNCVIIARAEAYAAKNAVLPAAIDGAAMGTGFALVLIALGAMREILANGTLLAGADRIFGHGINWTIQLYHSDNHIILAALPPGAFLCYGLLIAAKNLINTRLQRRKMEKPVSAPSR